MDLATALADLTLELLSIPSVTGSERAIADHLEGLCVARSGRGAVHRIGESVVVIPPGGEGLPTIGLFGHSDTVLPASDQPLGVVGGRVFGCGASDMKGALAVMLSLLEMQPSFTKARPLFVFYDKEEGPMADNGLEPVLESGVLPPMDLAIAMEPTDSAVQVGCVGSLHALVRVRGQRGHSARPWQGRNAIYRAAPLLAYLAGRAPRVRSIQGFVYKDVLSATQIHTYCSRNVVPDRVDINLNQRFVPGTSVEEAERALREELAPWLDGAELEVIDAAPSGAVVADHPLLRPWASQLGLQFTPKQAWTDVARLSQRGIPAVNFGPGETALAHQARESVAISDLVASHAALVELLA